MLVALIVTGVVVSHHIMCFLDWPPIERAGTGLHMEATSDKLLDLTDDALSHRQIPCQVLSDHGPQYYSENYKSRFKKH
jgi:hypothetical protein